MPSPHKIIVSFVHSKSMPLLSRPQPIPKNSHVVFDIIIIVIVVVDDDIIVIVIVVVDDDVIVIVIVVVVNITIIVFIFILIWMRIYKSLLNQLVNVTYFYSWSVTCYSVCRLQESRRSCK